MGDWFRAAGYDTYYRGKWHISHADLVVARHPRRAQDERRRRHRAARRRRRCTTAPTGSTSTASTGGSAASRTAPTRPTPVSSAIRSSPRRWPTCSASSREPRAHAAVARGGVVREPPRHRVRRPRVAAARAPAARRHRARLPRRPVTSGLARSPSPLSGPLPRRLAEGHLRRPERRRVPAPLPAGCTSSSTSRSSRPSTRSTAAGRRRHDRRVHVGPRRSPRRPRRAAAEVVQRVRRSGAGADGDRGPRDREHRAACRSPRATPTCCPTLLGLVGADVEELTPVVAQHHTEVQAFPGRDLSPMLTGRVDRRGARRADLLHDPGPHHHRPARAGHRQPRALRRRAGNASVESVIAHHDGELWKLNHYYDVDPDAPSPDDDEVVWELHNLTRDPEERENVADDDEKTFAAMHALLDETRGATDSRPRTPTSTNKHEPASAAGAISRCVDAGSLSGGRYIALVASRPRALGSRAKPRIMACTEYDATRRPSWVNTRPSPCARPRPRTWTGWRTAAIRSRRARRGARWRWT